MRTLKFLCLILIVFKSSVSQADTVDDDTPETQTTNWIAEVSRDPKPENQITDITLQQQRYPITLRRKDSKLRPFVEVRGSVTGKDSKLFLEDDQKLYPIEIKNGSFIIYMYLNSVMSELKLQLKTADEKLKKESITVSAPEVQEFRIGKPWGSLRLGLGLGNIRYRQTKLGEYASNNGLIKVNYETIDFLDKFHASLESLVSVWSIRSEPTNAAPQLIKFNGNLNYKLLDSRKKFQINTAAGIQYLTMLSNASSFGFSNLVAPEFGIKLKYDLGYFRTGINILYVPLGGFLSKKEYGGEAGFNIGTKIRSSHYLDFGVSYSTTNYQATTASQVKMDLLSFVLTYSI